MDKNKKLPSLLSEISNLAEAGKDTILGLLRKGEVKASNDLQKARMEICLQCEFLTDDFRCAKCGCFVRVKSTLLHGGKCPLGKWLEADKKIIKK